MRMLHFLVGRLRIVLQVRYFELSGHDRLNRTSSNCGLLQAAVANETWAAARCEWVEALCGTTAAAVRRVPAAALVQASPLGADVEGSGGGGGGGGVVPVADLVMQALLQVLLWACSGVVEGRKRAWSVLGAGGANETGLPFCECGLCLKFTHDTWM